MSTGYAHHKAQEPVIILPIPPDGDSSFEVDICGTQVSILVEFITYIDIFAKQCSRVLIYDWRKGQLRMDLSADSRYSAAVFLSTEIVLLAQETGGALELWNIPDVPEHIAGPEISLRLPPLPDHYGYCISRVKYNPKGNHAAASRQPFHSSLVHSLVMLNIMQVDNDGLDIKIMFLTVSRLALLERLFSAETPGEELSWSEWGPVFCRWFPTSCFIVDWQTITCGERCIFLMPDRCLLLLDFNPYTRKKALLEQEKQDSSAVPATGELEFVEELPLLWRAGKFSTRVLGEKVQGDHHLGRGYDG
ncbi:hypothetical protein MVEN_01064800 [Mycena venus]|uniref:Uncharacterized protein n=1 Tax=Mycena venus TaxID=2733690 RepID=A0A8H6Y421_9AGAR|nr:hypothetical protein MVEN_01064800 [Mycena venus]